MIRDEAEARAWLERLPEADGVALDRVGVAGLYFPLTIREKAGGQQAITARVDLMVGLHEDQRGAHLSSLVEALHVYQERLFRTTPRHRPPAGPGCSAGHDRAARVPAPTSGPPPAAETGAAGAGHPRSGRSP